MSPAKPLTAPLSVARRCYRLHDADHPDLDGVGAALVPGRWNVARMRVVYAAASFAGAVLEQLAHAGIGRLPPRAWCAIDLPAGVRVTTVTAEALLGWDDEDCATSRRFAASWFEGRLSVALFVPSKPGAPIEQNVVLNPAHPDFATLRISSPTLYQWDPRFHPPSL